MPHSREIKLGRRAPFFQEEADGLDRAAAHVAVALVGSLHVVVSQSIRYDPLEYTCCQLFRFIRYERGRSPVAIAM